MSNHRGEAFAAPPERPSDELVLAAIERAIRHDPRARGAASAPAIFEHLGVARRSGAARHARSRLAVMHAAGWIVRTSRHGLAAWAPSPAGRRYLARAVRAGRVPALPESPQHGRWRDARRTASQELERFRGELAAALARTSDLLDSEPVHSDAWFALGEELARACWRVGSASHCLREWPEPDEASADVDELREPGDERLGGAALARIRARRLGRRNVTLW